MIKKKKAIIKENYLIVKSNEIIGARWDLGKKPLLVIQNLLGMISKGDADFHRYSFNIDDLLKLLNIKREDGYKRKIKAVFKALQNNTIELTNGSIESSPAWIESPIYNWPENCVTLRVSELLGKYLLQLKSNFTQYMFSNLKEKQFSNRYSLHIYELLKQCEYKKKRVIKLKELRSLLKIDDTKYKRFNDFKKRVLDPCRTEISNLTDIAFYFDVIKKGRLIDQVEFTIVNRHKIEIRGSLGSTPRYVSYDALIDNGFSDERAKVLSEQYGVLHAEYVLTNIDYANKKYKIILRRMKEEGDKGKKPNLQGYITRALEKNYALFEA